jgi:hypothetical protein
MRPKLLHHRKEKRRKKYTHVHGPVGVVDSSSYDFALMDEDATDRSFVGGQRIFRLEEV